MLQVLLRSILRILLHNHYYRIIMSANIYLTACEKLGQDGRHALQTVSHLPMAEHSPYAINHATLAAKGTDGYDAQAGMWLKCLSAENPVSGPVSQL